jgi:hypothetical protein
MRLRNAVGYQPVVGFALGGDGPSDSVRTRYLPNRITIYCWEHCTTCSGQHIAIIMYIYLLLLSFPYSLHLAMELEFNINL